MLSLEESKDRYQGIFIAAPVPMKNDYSLICRTIGKCVECLIDAGMKSGNAVVCRMWSRRRAHAPHGRRAQGSGRSLRSVCCGSPAGFCGGIPSFDIGVSRISPAC